MQDDFKWIESEDMQTDASVGWYLLSGVLEAKKAISALSRCSCKWHGVRNDPVYTHGESAVDAICVPNAATLQRVPQLVGK